MDHSPNSLQDLDGCPKLKKTMDNMHACQDALLNVFRGYIVAAASTELNIGGPEGHINESLLEDLTMKVASRFTVIPEALLNESVADTAGD